MPKKAEYPAGTQPTRRRFSLANHDLDIRGAGNILGIEQSGHIKDVGIALYHHLLEEEINRLKAGESDKNSQTAAADTDWTVQILTGVPIIIPENMWRT